MTYAEGLADLCPLCGVLVAGAFGEICGCEGIVDLFEGAFEVEDILGVATENV